MERHGISSLLRRRCGLKLLSFCDNRFLIGISSLLRRRCGLKLIRCAIVAKNHPFHLCFGGDVDWNDYFDARRGIAEHFISASAEMWIETYMDFYNCLQCRISSLLRRRCGLKLFRINQRCGIENFISASAEMWIETVLHQATRPKGDDFISASAEMWIETSVWNLRFIIE